MPFNKIYPFKHAPQGIILNENDQYLTDCIRQTGEFSEDEVNIFRECMPPDALAIEVGGNMGAHTLALAELAKWVITFEPQRFMFQTLCGNLALNSVSNVIALNQAVGGLRKEIVVPSLDPNLSNNFGGLSLVDGAVGKEFGGEAITQVTIDQFGFNKLDFLKMDCEGMELDVLNGAERSIEAYRPIIYLEYTSNRQALLHWLESRGFLCLRHLPWHTHQEGITLASDMLLAMPKEKPPLPTMGDGFGRRNILFKPNTEDILGKPATVEIWEPYGSVCLEP